MSKEMMIVFVYDTEYCQKEEDDPVGSVLYFHPSWVSDVQKLSLCGQLMGTTYFLKESFFSPKIISLQNGKFCIKSFGRFVMAVGTDRNINETLLEYRATLLKSLLETYHCDIQTIYNQFSITGQYKNISEKLYHIFETYLPVLQYKGSLFQNMPFLKLPKSGNHIFLEAMQLLKYFQEKPGVLGGSILYHNKVVANQLPADLAKVLIMTDPHRIKATADNVQVDFHVPIGVQLIVVYLQNSEFTKLRLDSNLAQTSFRNLNGTNVSSALPFQIKRKIKSDKPLIFSHIPEEEPVIINDKFSTDAINKRTVKFNRPNNLPLRIKTVVSKEIPESGFNSINFDESDSFPEFIGKTSVVSTPMTENKVLLNADILSICMNAKSELQDKITDPCENGLQTDEKMDDIQFFEYNNFFNNFFKNSFNLRKNKSLNDLNILKKNTGNNITMKKYGIGLKKLQEREYSKNSGIEEEYELDETIDDVIDDKNLNYHTITDPNYPVINNNNKPISNYLYQYYFDKFNDCGNIDITNKIESEDRDETDNHLKWEPESKESKDQNNLEINHQEIKDVSANFSLAVKGNGVGTVEFRGPKANKSDRKSLSLPIRSMSTAEATTLDSENIAKGLPFESSVKRNKLTGIQLTPLMNKLTLLSALNQEIDIKSSGFSSWDTTPGYGTPPDVKLLNKTAGINPIPCGNKHEELIASKNDQKLKRLELFIYGEKNSTLFLLLDTSEMNTSNKKELMHSIWELCITRLTKIETSLFQILNLNVETANEKLQDGDYSYINFDKTWDVLERSGPWTLSNFNSMEHLHKEFDSNKHLSEILLRNNDAVIYGYQSGVSEIYYQQTAHSHSGLPPPADPMGAVQLSAKRRLERDHSIIIL